MKRMWIPIVVSMVCFGCATDRSDSLDLSSGKATLSRVVELGPYRVQYGAEGTNDSLYITRGEERVYSKSGDNITVYAGGRSLFDYACTGPGNAIAAYMVHIRDAKGNIAFTLMDENADGVFDRKIDFGTKAIYQWKDNQWTNWGK